ncbi:MAG: hypothetical protein V2A56_01420 [bacterium]
MSARRILLLQLISGFLLSFLKVNAGANQRPPSAESSDLDCPQRHVEDNWTQLRQPLRFNHQKTAFPLPGKHQKTSCQACHPGGSREKQHAFSTAPTNRATCYADVHRAEMGVQCERCHSPEDLHGNNLLFDHDGDSRFALRGAHERVACSDCHHDVERADGKSYVRYKPLDLACASCHSPQSIKRWENEQHN